MLHLKKLRALLLVSTSNEDHPSHINTASGIMQAGTYLYLVTDNERHLGVFSLDGSQPGRLLRLFPGQLPVARDKRKARKPDLEALVRLPLFPAYPHGALLALRSGLILARRKGRCVASDAGV